MSGRGRAGRRCQSGLGLVMFEHELVRSHCFPVFPVFPGLGRMLSPERSLPFTFTGERQADLIHAGTG